MRRRAVLFGVHASTARRPRVLVYGGGTLDFERVDAKHPPTLTAIRGDASASILFMSVGGELELKRSELKSIDVNLAANGELQYIAA